MSNERKNNFFNFLKNSIIMRILLIGILILLLLIPFSMILSLINERENRRNDVYTEISKTWASEQTISGPILDIPYIDYVEESSYNDKGKEIVKINKVIKFAHFMPNSLSIKGKLIPETRSRGIYKITVYTADLDITGTFLYPDFNKLHITSSNIKLNEASINFGITDMIGINKNINFLWNDEKILHEPGLSNNDIMEHGIISKVKILSQNKFSIKLNVKGSSQISFLPTGKETTINISSPWKTPSFNGTYLPKNRTINDDGFNATWEIFDYNRDFPQQWNDKQYDISKNTFGVELFTQVDEYQKTTRSAKYAILFISLTFLFFFLLIELFNKKRIHPIQYLLVGFTLCMFYVLLLSISEYLSFNISYFISMFAVLCLTIFYTKNTFGKISLSIIMTILLSALYLFLFIIIQLEDYSLLTGSIGLFIILAAIMLYTRKIDFYNLKLDNK